MIVKAREEQFFPIDFPKSSLPKRLKKKSPNPKVINEQVKKQITEQNVQIISIL